MVQKHNTFAGFPAGDIKSNDPADIIIIGIPYGVPYIKGEKSPSHNAPDAIRAESMRYPEDIHSWDFDLNATLGNGKFP